MTIINRENHSKLRGTPVVDKPESNPITNRSSGCWRRLVIISNNPKSVNGQQPPTTTSNHQQPPSRSSICGTSKDFTTGNACLRPSNRPTTSKRTSKELAPPDYALAHRPALRHQWLDQSTAQWRIPSWLEPVGLLAMISPQKFIGIDPAQGHRQTMRDPENSTCRDSLNIKLIRGEIMVQDTTKKMTFHQC